MESADEIVAELASARASMAECCRGHRPMLEYEPGITTARCSNKKCGWGFRLADWKPQLAARQWNGEVSPDGVKRIPVKDRAKP